MAALACVQMALAGVFAAQPIAPKGEYAELHACEVYTGGCTASAQSTTGGRSLLRVWKFEAGAVRNVPLDGLSVVVLEMADANLALPDTTAKTTVAYLPSQATADQRSALQEFLKESGVAVTDAQVVPVSYKRDASCLSVAAGEQVDFTTRAIEHCDSGACGEQLWYEPRGQIGAYTVLVNDHSRVDEPKFHLVWKDNSARSVFFGRFGVPGKPEFTLAAIP